VILLSTVLVVGFGLQLEMASRDSEFCLVHEVAVAAARFEPELGCFPSLYPAQMADKCVFFSFQPNARMRKSITI